MGLGSGTKLIIIDVETTEEKLQVAIWTVLCIIIRVLQTELPQDECAPSPGMVSLPSLPDLPLLHISSLLAYPDLVSLGQVRPGNQ